MIQHGSDQPAFNAAAFAQSLAKEQGFALCGIASADASQYAGQLKAWLAEGKHGAMQYLADHADIRTDPGRLVEGAASVIVVADAYHPQTPGPEPQAPTPAGRVAKYAWGDDYHKVLKKRLHKACNALEAEYPGHTYRATTDTAPIFERELATRAGLGWTGKHTLMIHPRFGSYFLLGTIVTTLPMQTSELAGFPAPLSPPTDHCGSCSRCIDACPTDAIASEGYSVDARRCISYLTLEHRGSIDEQYHEPMGDWLAGCDICQDVCPHNRRRADLAAQDADPLQVHARYTPHNYAGGFDLLKVLNWAAEDRQQAFIGSALKRVKLDMMQRNALIAAGNALAQQDDPVLREKVIELAQADNQRELVRETANKVCERLGFLP
ncbi:MAG: tRNA epoxyqueuosine(34) reductase QueG [Phycisphaeraceae bacterium]|nr:tRNA epoxyqueuosine(34) reductase QueG [Phycisphaeraceae bacterium]